MSHIILKGRDNDDEYRVAHVVEDVNGVPESIICYRDYTSIIGCNINYTKIEFIKHNNSDVPHTLSGDYICCLDARRLTWSNNITIRVDEPIKYDPVMFTVNETFAISDHIVVINRVSGRPGDAITHVTTNNIGTIISFNTVSGRTYNILYGITPAHDILEERNGAYYNMPRWPFVSKTCFRWRSLVHKVLNAARLRHKYRPDGVWFRRMVLLDKQTQNMIKVKSTFHDYHVAHIIEDDNGVPKTVIVYLLYENGTFCSKYECTSLATNTNANTTPHTLSGVYSCELRPEVFFSVDEPIEYDPMMFDIKGTYDVDGSYSIRKARMDGNDFIDDIVSVTINNIGTVVSFNTVSIVERFDISESLIFCYDIINNRPDTAYDIFNNTDATKHLMPRWPIVDETLVHNPNNLTRIVE